MGVKKTAVKKVEGGEASVFMSIKLSKDYNSFDFGCGLTLPIQPGEKEEDALKRVDSVVAGFHQLQGGRRLAEMSQVVAKTITAKKRSR